MSDYIQDRFQEMSAATAAGVIVRDIMDKSQEPNPKKFTKSRQARLARWLDLIDLATERIQKLKEVEAKPAKTEKAVEPAVAT